MALPAELAKNLRIQDWRLNNLYWIKDKENRKVKFVMNPEQREYYENQHTRNLILKARQLGFTTEELMIQLDSALFESKACALIAHKLDDAKRLFLEKVLFAYENLPHAIKAANPVKNERADELRFKNGGSITVSTGFRGGTLSRLHVSEFGKICAKDPEKAREIVTGAFEAVGVNCVITIESTAEGREGRFYDYSQSAEKLKISGAQLNPLDFKFFFFPWWKNKDYSLPGDYSPPEHLSSYFEDLTAKRGTKLTIGQMKWYQSKMATLGDDMKREYPSHPEEAFQQSVDGAYYAKQFRKIYEDGRVCVLPKNDHQPIDTYWDIGVGDSTAIWFVRKIGEQFHFVDFYENSGEGLQHYMKVLKKKGYNYGKHYGPHDIENREFGSDAKSRKEIARSGYEIDGQKYSINFNVVPVSSIDTGIESAREILAKCVFDEARCDQGIKCLENYRKEWDEKKGCWKDRPLHDWASHGADAFRYFAVTNINIKAQVRKTGIGTAF